MFLFVFLLNLCFFSVIKAEDKNLTIWYRQPARVWEECIPLGNGRLGAMPDGGIYQENITLNEISLWSGSVEDTNNPEALKHLPQIRKLLLEGKNFEAQEIMYKYFKCGGQGSGFGNGANIPFGCYQKLADLHINYKYITPNRIETIGENYCRTLSLENSIATTSYQIDGIKYSREYFVSQANDVIIIKLTTGRKRTLNFDVTIDREMLSNTFIRDKELHMDGQLNNGINGKGMKYSLITKVIAPDGTNSFLDKTIQIRNATTAYIFISATTDFNQPNFEKKVKSIIVKAIKEPYRKLKSSHVKKYQKKFNRVQLTLGNEYRNLSINDRLKEFQLNDSAAMAALYFQFGRYLLISGTREENTLPLNLQGLWTDKIQTPWNGDYHLNINLQMNYWPIEVCNLPELMLPLTGFIKELMCSGENTAKSFYNAEGWIAHVITNPWKFTAPAEHAGWGATNTGGAWLCANLWEHYEFTNDKKYLKEIFPILKGATKFFLTNMIKERSHGWLVTAPSSSPENSFKIANSEKPIYVCMAPTMDIQIITELYRNTLNACKVLSVDSILAKNIETALSQFPPMQISKKNGCLQEWLEDYEETDPEHRHVSHLYGLYPGKLITCNKTPELIAACKNTLERRGDDGTGWSRAWKINFWARLKDGNHAYKLLKNLLKPSSEYEIDMKSGGGTYPNLFCAHPPFQIDGNLGGCAGIAEMLLQSHDGIIELLPAIPDCWRNGRFKGLKARNGIEVSAFWENKKILKVNLKSIFNQTVKLKVNDSFRLIKLKKGVLRVIDCSY